MGFGEIIADLGGEDMIGVVCEGCWRFVLMVGVGDKTVVDGEERVDFMFMDGDGVLVENCRWGRCRFAIGFCLRAFDALGEYICVMVVLLFKKLKKSERYENN